MGDPAFALDSFEKKQPKDSVDLIKSTHTSEIVIALCGQLGTDLKKIENLIIEELETKYKYEYKVIKLSDFISQYTKYKLNRYSSEYERIKAGMDGGNELRERHGNKILAELAIREIISDKTQNETEDNLKKEKFSSKRKCYIINSLKHPEEFQLLSEVYRDIFYVIGIFSPIINRLKFLERKLGKKSSNIYELIDRDTGEDKLNGQNVESTFEEADYFMRISSMEKSKIKPKIERFFHLIFDVGVNTPSIEETAMYQAAAASVNSACLSRQVGACITDDKGSILALGWNDVPSFGGNLYPNLELKIDERCFNSGDCDCANKIRKDQMTKNIINKIKTEKIVENDSFDLRLLQILENNGIKNLIEFSRSIHAEMHAIIIGSQKTGNKMIGGKLFCTTYPCHNCARHIIVAGIKEVYYIEPYKKSLSTDLHSDALTDDENENNKVKILMYEGVAPKKYMTFYKLNIDNRKEKVKHQDLTNISPKNTITLRALHQLEASITENLKSRGF